MRMFLLVPAFVAAAPLFAAPVLVDRIGAVVNGEPIACSEVLADAEALARELGRKPDQELVRQALDARIVRTLELQEAKRLKLAVPDEELARTIASIEERNGLAPGMLAEALKAQGISFARYKQRLRERLLIAKLINSAVRAQIKIPEEVLREAWRRRWKNRTTHEVRLAQIFLALPPNPAPEDIARVRARLEALRKRALAGEDFGKLARLYSQSPDREQGGDLGWIASEAAPPFLRPVLALPEGAISEPVRSPAGMHLFRVLARRTRTLTGRGEAYEEVHVRQIVLRIPKDADAETRARIQRRAEALARELADADDEAFARRAREVSQGPNAEQGGDLGWLRTDQMLPQLARAVAKLAPGQTSGVVQSPFGLHVLRLVARRRVDPNSFEALRDQIEAALVNAAMQERLPGWIADLKARAHIEVRGCDQVAWPFANP